MSKKKKNSKSPVLKIVSNWVSNIFLVGAIILLIASIFIVFKNEDTPQDAFLLGYKPIYIKTGSMEPTLKVNSLAIVKKVDYEDIKEDDIIMYFYDDKMITHRVINITEEGIRTKGDNNPVEDTYYLQPENIRGKVVCILSITATISSEIKTPAGIFKWIVCPIAIIVIVVSIIFVKKSLKTDSKKSNTVKQKRPTSPTQAKDKSHTNSKKPKTEGTSYISENKAVINLENLKTAEYDANMQRAKANLDEYFTWKEVNKPDENNLQ